LWRIDTPDAWRNWLATHADSHEEAWLVSYRRDSARPFVSEGAAVDAAMCFGWARGASAYIDDNSFLTRWSRRAPKRPWTSGDLVRARRLLAAGLVARQGIESLPRSLRPLSAGTRRRLPE
jgi:hypothetical protein